MIAVGRVFRAVPALMLLQGLQYLVPLITIPFLMRVLGLERWGQVTQLMAFGQLALILLDYGLHLSAAQAAARQHDNREALAVLFGAVTVAKLAVCIGAVPLLLLAADWLVPGTSGDSLQLWALAAAALQAHDPLWYFLGTERAARILALTIIIRLVAVGIMVATVRGPADAWVFFALQVAVWACVLATALWVVRRETGLGRRHFTGCWTILRDGRKIFQFYLGSSSFDYLVPLVLGIVADPVAVGLFVGAEKLARAAASLLSSSRAVLFPQMNRLMAAAWSDAARLFRWSLVWIGGLAAVGSGLLFFTADRLVPLVLGAAAVPAIPVLQILSPFPLLMTLNSLIGMQWLIPANRAAALRNIYIGTGLFRLLLCALLGAEMAAAGAAWAVVAGELCVLGTFLLYLRHHPVRQA